MLSEVVLQPSSSSLTPSSSSSVITCELLDTGRRHRRKGFICNPGQSPAALKDLRTEFFKLQQQDEVVGACFSLALPDAAKQSRGLPDHMTDLSIRAEEKAQEQEEEADKTYGHRRIRNLHRQYTYNDMSATCGLPFPPLNSVPVFQNLEPEKLATLIGNLEEAHFDDGHYIIRQGARGDTFYIITSGTVKVTQTAKDGKENFIRNMGRAEWFGEKALQE
ncbi:cGMP-dependent protein kinase 1 [Cichlidogyrus casuarinus]|uniref:cGMP-dependent protein kinase 1 n=1 Tax=Cichlidogyrus casuarinus TaxID=1844966 RepID=A0ABD2PMZ4_9PLAT